MPIYKQLFFRESALAHQLLDGLTGLEVGGSRHNQWGLDIINVDKFGETDPRGQIYRDEQIRLCGQFLPVDIVADGDNIPVPDKSFDFVIASHVIEHFFDPIAALKEWARIARKYVYIVCPQGADYVKDGITYHAALESDRGKLITPLDTLFARHQGKIPDPKTDEHHTRWTCDTFKEMCAALGFYVSHSLEIDDKVGNGFTVVIDLQPENIKIENLHPIVQDFLKQEKRKQRKK